MTSQRKTQIDRETRRESGTEKTNEAQGRETDPRQTARGRTQGQWLPRREGLAAETMSRSSHSPLGRPK